MNTYNWTGSDCLPSISVHVTKKGSLQSVPDGQDYSREGVSLVLDAAPEHVTVSAMQAL